MSKITKAEIIRRHWLLACRNKSAKFSAEHDIDTDGRTRKGTVREVLAEGWLQEVTPGETYVCTPALANSVQAIRPDLAALAKLETYTERYPLKERVGVALGSLTPEALRYVAEHQADYKTADRWGKPTDFESTYWDDCFISDPDFDSAKDKIDLRLKQEYARPRNLAWGLKQADLIQEVDADVFNTRDPGGGFRFGGGSPLFGSDPEKWGEDAERIVKELRERIARDTRAANAILQADAKVQAAGGWAKFVESYTAKIDAAIAERHGKGGES